MLRAGFCGGIGVCFGSASGQSGRGCCDRAGHPKLVSAGDVDRGIQVLRDHLAKNATDVKTRGILGRILDFDGKPDEAVTTWEAQD